MTLDMNLEHSDKVKRISF